MESTDRAPRRRHAAIAMAAFVVLLALQSAVVWAMYVASKQALQQRQAEETRWVVDFVKPLLHDLAPAETSSERWRTVLQRIADAYQVHQLMIVDPERAVLADLGGAPRGSPASVLSVSPAGVEEAMTRGRLVQERLSLVEGDSRRLYLPLHHNQRPWAVVVMELDDPLPAHLASLKRPLSIGFGFSLISALILSLTAYALLERLDRSRRQIGRMERLAAAGTLAASIAHEIKNPMGTILSTAQLLARSAKVEPEDRPLLDSIQDEVRRVDDQINAFLDLTREIPLRPRRLDLNDVVRGALDMLRHQAQIQGVRIETCLAERKLAIEADERRLRQALINLLLNGLDAASSQAQGRIRVETTVDFARHMATACIEDNGPGVEKAQRRALFEPFVSTKAHGTGLGLSIAERVVQRHGGRLWLDEQAEAGARFCVELPLADNGKNNEDPDR